MQNWGAIFDWDGVIVESSRQHLESWQLLADELGKSLPPDFFLKSFGMKGDKIIADFLGWSRQPEKIREFVRRKELLYREIIAKKGIAPLAGVENFLKNLRAASVPCAVASSTPRENIDFVMKMVGLEKHFCAIVAGEDVNFGKPHPEPFLLAAKKIGVPPDFCVVFEDAHVGIEAARAAKMRVIGVATTHPAETLRDADRVVRRLDELSVSEIGGWFR
jgi:beta-phosphoglucomutase family hydrolase